MKRHRGAEQLEQCVLFPATSLFKLCYRIDSLIITSVTHATVQTMSSSLNIIKGLIIIISAFIRLL